MYVYFYSLHVSGNYVPIIRRNNCINATPGICHSVWMTVWYAGWDARRSSTQSDKYQVPHWYSYFSWWWAQSCSNYVENRNKHTKNCAWGWFYLQDNFLYMISFCQSCYMYCPYMQYIRASCNHSKRTWRILTMKFSFTVFLYSLQNLAGSNFF